MEILDNVEKNICSGVEEKSKTSFFEDQTEILSREEIFLRKSNARSSIIEKDYKRLFDLKTTETALVLLSGGIDSTTALWLSKHFYPHVIGVEYDYEGRPKIEKGRVREICDVANVEMYTIAYPEAIMNSVETLSLPNNVTLKESNSIYYILAGNLGMKLSKHIGNSKNNITIVAGQILSDWLPLKDFNENISISFVKQASPRMYKILNLMLQEEYGKTSPVIETPLIYISKREVVQLAKDLKVPLELTWSCPKSSIKECGECPQCLEKIDAFKYNKIKEKYE